MVMHAFVTSQGSWPTSDDAFPWFNMWMAHLWPYDELEEEDTLFWYDSKAKAIVLETKVLKVDRFQYPNKDYARQRLQEGFYNDPADPDPADDPYFQKKASHGFCLAYRVMRVRRLKLDKPADYKFPRSPAWLRCHDKDAPTWLLELAKSPHYGRYTRQLEEAAANAEAEGYFDPASLEDHRARLLRAIVQRQGGPEFRAKLIDAYHGRCAITGCDAEQALEAAHIHAYLGPASNHVSNGLLLRADIHTLFDLHLLAIEPSTITVVVSSHLGGTMYGEFHGKKIHLPEQPGLQPSTKVLEERWKLFESDSWHDGK